MRILLFLSVTFKTPTKNAYSFLKVHLHHSSKIKSHKEVTKQLLVDGRIRIQSQIWIRIRTNKLRIRMRIPGAQKHTDPTDPDPEHCLKSCSCSQLNVPSHCPRRLTYSVHKEYGTYIDVPDVQLHEGGGG